MVGIIMILLAFSPLKLSATSVLDLLETESSLFIDIEFGANIIPIDAQRFAG